MLSALPADVIQYLIPAGFKSSLTVCTSPVPPEPERPAPIASVNLPLGVTCPQKSPTDPLMSQYNPGADGRVPWSRLRAPPVRLILALPTALLELSLIVA